MKPLLTASLLSLALAVPCAYARAPLAPGLKGIVLPKAPGKDFIIWMGRNSVVNNQGLTIAGTDDQGNIRVTLPSGKSALLPAEMMENRTVGQLVQLTNAAINEDTWESVDISTDNGSDTVSSSDANESDFGGDDGGSPDDGGGDEE